MACSMQEFKLPKQIGRRQERCCRAHSRRHHPHDLAAPSARYGGRIRSLNLSAAKGTSRGFRHRRGLCIAWFFPTAGGIEY